MTKNIASNLTKSLFAAALAVTVSAARAEMTDAVDQSLAQSAEGAVHQEPFNSTIRVQAVDGVVYLYGRASTYTAEADLENAVQAAVPGHKVVSTIENGYN